ATVNYVTATARDYCGGSVPPVHSPAQGAVFPIGDTTVQVTASDASGNPASPCSFKVHVQGATEQINELIGKINAIPGLKSPNKTAFTSKLEAALSDLAHNAKADACSDMQDFLSLVKAANNNKLIAAAIAADLTADATRIRTVIGCR